jgi:histidinol-phosphate aminotransferase
MVMTNPLSPRASYGDIKLYAPDSRVYPVDLSDNTNRWGAPPAALREFRSVGHEISSRYPSVYSEELKRALADFAGVDESMIVTGCGSDDILDLSFRAFGETGDVVAMIEPSFVMIPAFSRMNGLRCEPVPLTSTYDADAERIVALDARIVYLCSPNNPTGAPLSRAAIEFILERSRGLVIIDEAYVDFAIGNAVDLVSRFPNLLISRTLSKAFGLAGLRVGYGIGNPSIIAAVEKSRGPFKLTAIAERAAHAVFMEDLPWVREHVTLAIESRTLLTRELRKRSIDVPESATNFVFAPVANAGVVAARMGATGVAVRAYDGLPQFSPGLRASLGGALRISVGPAAEIAMALGALDEALS